MSWSGWVEVVPEAGTEGDGVQVVSRYGQAVYGHSVYGGQVPALAWVEMM